MIFQILSSIALFTIIDKILERYNYNGRYYFNHFICNSIVVYNTFYPMLSCYINIQDITGYELTLTKSVIYGIHLYHILVYYNKLRYDDWLHHILMIGVTLPLTDVILQTNTISHGIFFTTGLPGMIDYFLLFLTRNNYLHKSIEKYINTFINLWIRCPGCIMNTTLSIHYLLNYSREISNYELYSIIFILSSIYWNGIYFMNQTVQDLTLYKKSIKMI